MMMMRRKLRWMMLRMGNCMGWMVMMSGPCCKNRNRKQFMVRDALLPYKPAHVAEKKMPSLSPPDSSPCWLGSAHPRGPTEQHPLHFDKRLLLLWRDKRLVLLHAEEGQQLFDHDLRLG